MSGLGCQSPHVSRPGAATESDGMSAARAAGSGQNVRGGEVGLSGGGAIRQRWTECPRLSGMSIYPAVPAQLLRVRRGSLWWVATNPTLQTCFCSWGLWGPGTGSESKKAAAWSLGGVVLGEIPSPTQTISEHHLDFQDANLRKENQWWIC